jgi:hypothetical protein
MRNEEGAKENEEKKGYKEGRETSSGRTAKPKIE